MVLRVELMMLRVLLVHLEIQVFQGLPAETVFPERTDSLDLPVLLEPLASAADLSFPRWLTAVRNPAAPLSPGPQAPWVPVAPLDLQVLLALRDSLDPQASLESLVLLARWVLAVLLVLLERMERMVKLAKLAVLESADPPDLRVLVDSQEPLDSPASRDTEVSLV